MRDAKISEIKKQLAALDVKVDKGILAEGELLKLEDLSMHFGGLKAVDKLSFTVKEGEIFGLIGPNGAGKTTVFNCITRFYKPTSGKMHFKNKINNTVDLNELVVHNIIREGITRTFQNVEMIWELNILENLLVAAHTEYRSGFFGHLFNSRLLRHEEVVIKSKAYKILTDLDLLQYAYQYPMGLPYGILKKIELARTLMVNPKLIILDEPAAGLNDVETDALAKTIHKIREEYNTTIFLVEHDMGLVMEICDTVCAISFGKKLAIGTPKEIQNSKVVREAYLGGE
ncbi:MAG: ABC transporter ATP-binding protein [Tenericutes bacterium]|nr:ABC transporter ATP-binding protein [Mycoplasmatota bacterium]